MPGPRPDTFGRHGPKPATTGPETPPDGAHPGNFHTGVCRGYLLFPQSNQLIAQTHMYSI